MEETAVEALAWQARLDLSQPCTDVLKQVMEIFRESTREDRTEVLATALADLADDPDGIMSPDHDHASEALAKAKLSTTSTFDQLMRRAVKAAVKSKGETASVLGLMLQRMRGMRDQVCRQTRKALDKLDPEGLEDLVSELVFKHGRSFLARCMH